MRGPFLRRHVVSIAIVAATVGLGAYLYFVDSGRVTTGEADARKRNLFRAFRRGEITTLLIENDGETTRISRHNDDAGDAMYYLDGEIADQTAVDKTLSVLEFATAERRVDGAIDRHATGLDTPNTRVTLSMGSITYRLAIGGPAPAPAGAAYAEVEGEGVSVVARDVVTELARPRDFYRGKTLVPYLSSSLSELSLQGAGGTRHLRMASWGGWAIELEAGRSARVDRDAFDRLLTGLAEVRAEAFTTESDAERVLGAASEKIRIAMIPSDKALPSATLELGGECPGHAEDTVALRSEPAPKKAACVPKGVLEPLSLSGARLADLHLFSQRPDEMEQIALVSGDQKLDIIRAGAGWHMRAPTEGQVESDVGLGFARTLQHLVGEEIVTGAPEGVKFSRATATLTKTNAGEDAGGAEVVEVAPPGADGFTFVRRKMDGAVLKVTNDTAAALVPNSFALRSRKVVDVPLGHVSRIAIHGPDVQQVLRRSTTGAWTLEEPRGLAVDPGLAGDVAEALAQLRAERWVADRDDGSFGLAAPTATYELDREAGAIRIDTGRATSGGVFAKRADQEGVFVLPRATAQAVQTWAIDRSYCMAEPKDVRRITIERGNERVVLDARAKADGGAAERFEIASRALADARAEGTVHLGAARKEEGFDAPLAKVTIERAASSNPPRLQIVIGRGDAWRDTNVFYVRREGVDATFAIAQSKLRPLLDLR